MPISLKRFKFNYSDRLLVSFVLGVVTGTVLVNLLGEEVRSQAGYFGGYFTASYQRGSQEKKELLLIVIRQRLLETCFLWLVGLTVFSAPCFCVMSAYYGLSAGLILSVTTCQKGLMGLPCYLITMLPHYLIYIPIWYVLAMWAGDKSGKIRLVPLAGLLMFSLIGAFLETYINPYLLQMLL